MLVPGEGALARNGSVLRPDHPPLANKAKPGPTQTTTPTRTSSGAPHKQSWMARNQRRVGLMLGTMALILIGWSWAGLEPRADVTDTAGSGLPPITMTDPSTAPPAYFGVPLHGPKICYVVDADQSMADYVDRIMLHATATNATIKPGTWRMGVIQAIGTTDHGTQLEITPLTGNLRLAAAKIKTKRPQGETDLKVAMNEVAKWDVDQILLILAKNVSQAELESILEAAHTTDAAIDIIAFGDALTVDLSGIAQATGGHVTKVPDEELKQIIEADKSILTSLQKWR